MGKGARLRAARAGGSGEPTVPGIEDARRTLYLAAQVVTLLFRETPDCAGAAALLCALGDALGTPLRARPVSVFGVNDSTGDVFTMGPKARAKLPEDVLAKMEDHRPAGKDTGHMVVTSDDALLLLDPNLTQVRTYGMDAPAIAMRVKSTEPQSGEWTATFGSFHVVYFVDDENEVLLPRFHSQYRAVRPRATAIAESIRNGSTAEEIVKAILG